MSIKIALAGNPNCGKTTMFNDLTGSNQYVGNWPGVTVEKKEGKWKTNKDIIIQDLPGIYSLSPYTLEEVISRNYLINQQPDAILNIVDGTNLERNLYLTTQLLELGLPMAIALNMMDVVRKNGDTIDVSKLSEALGCPIVETAALRGEGSQKAVEAAVQAAQAAKPQAHPSVFGGTVEHAIAHIEESIEGKVPAAHLRWYAVKLFERDDKVRAQLQLPASLMAHIEEHIQECERELEDDSESIITNERYAYISKLMTVCIRKKPRKDNLSVSDKIDRVVTNRILALPIFVAVMTLVYYVSVTTIGDIVTGFTNDTLFGSWIQEPLAAWLEGIGTAGWLNGLVVDGIVGGVGAVIGFVPQMLILFIFLAILEDIGYMARVAFIMDRIFRKFGLSGKSFIPMLIGSGCGVPGIMASRTIENERDRRMTIMTTTFIPCGAKMPIVALIAGAVFGGAWWVSPAAYFIGVGCDPLGHHPEKDQNVRRRPRPLRHGAARLPCPPGRQRAQEHVGAGLELHQAGRYGDPGLQHPDLVPVQLWQRGRRLYHGRGYGPQHPGRHGQHPGLDLHAPGLWQLAVHRGHHHGPGGQGRSGRRVRRALWGGRGRHGIGGIRRLPGAGPHRRPFHRAVRLLLPDLQPAVRPLLRRHRRHQAGDEFPQVDLVRHRLSVRPGLCGIPDRKPAGPAVHHRRLHLLDRCGLPAGSRHPVPVLPALPRSYHFGYRQGKNPSLVSIPPYLHGAGKLASPPQTYGAPAARRFSGSLRRVNGLTRSNPVCLASVALLLPACLFPSFPLLHMNKVRARLAAVCRSARFYCKYRR